MNGSYLRFYVRENHKHRHRLVYEWLLESARKLGIPGGSAFRAMAGYGRHGTLHEAHFIELQGDLPVEVAFMVTETEAAQLLALLESERLALFYAKSPVEFGVTGHKEDPQS